MTRVEDELVLLYNAELFRLYSEGQPNGFPLLNISGAKKGNPYVLGRDQQIEYRKWLEGSWWRK